MTSPASASSPAADPAPRRRARPQARGPPRRHRESSSPPVAAARVAAGRLAPRRDAIGAAGLARLIGKYKTAKHFDRRHHRRRPGHRAQPGRQTGQEARLDGIYVIRTPVPESELGPAEAVTAYKNLRHVERDFRHIKSDDLDLRPVFHHPGKRVKGHVLICMLAAYLTWHLRQAWAPLTYTDEEPPQPGQPRRPRPPLGVQPTPRPHASTTSNGRPYLSFPGLLAHLGTLTRNELRHRRHPRRRSPS